MASSWPNDEKQLIIPYWLLEQIGFITQEGENYQLHQSDLTEGKRIKIHYPLNLDTPTKFHQGQKIYLIKHQN